MKIDRLEVEILSDGRTVKLTNPFIAIIGEKVITVPEGFKSDFASVPRFFWRILPPWGEYSPAAVVHDYLYRMHKVSREKADKIFLTYMELLGVSWWKRKAMYRAVRLFGGAAWDENSREKL